MLSTREGAAIVDDEEIPEDVFATLPNLPTINGFTSRLADIQNALEQARVEAETLKDEIQKKASALRALAGALEAAL